MKVYVTDEKELIMEPVLKWAGNPNVTVAAKAYGLKATVQVIYNIYLLFLRKFFFKIIFVGFFLINKVIISGGGFTSLCFTSYHSKTTCS